MPNSVEPAPRQDARVLAALQRVTDAALAHLSQDELLTELLRRITEILSTDTAAILLLNEAGDTLVARAAKGIEEEVEQGVRIPIGEGFAGRVVAERRAVVIDDVDDSDILNPILREKGIRSMLGVPLLVEGRALGVLHVGSLTPRRFTAGERDLLQLAADRAAMAIEHALLYNQERRARAAAEAASERLAALQRITDAGLAYLSQDDLLIELLNRISDILSTDTAAILLLNQTGDTLVARAAKGIEEEVEQGVRIPLGAGFAGRIAAERRAVMVEDIDHYNIYNPILRQKGIRSLLGVPLLVEGRVLGVLHVGSLTLRRFTAGERDLVQLAADRAAIAIEHARLYEQRRLAEAVQRRLLPERMERVVGLDLASRYLPASGESLGGDWYDAFPIGGSRVVLAVGDVVGHGLTAAAGMAQLRTALRAYAIDGHSPGAVVERVNRLMWDLGPPAMTTLAFAVLDLEAETLELVNAGHPPPLVIGTDGRAEFLPLQGGVALGAQRGRHYHADLHPFPTGSTIVLYTDGLVEDRSRSIDEGLERLRALSAGRSDLEDLCAVVVEQMVPAERADDVAIIAARVAPPGDMLAGRWPARKGALVEVRGALRRWLRARGATADELYDITVACQEACANAIEHAYGPGTATFDVDATCDDRRVRITVRDHGGWRPARGANRGRGVPLMRGLMDRVEIRHDDEGTVVELERTLGRPRA